MFSRAMVIQGPFNRAVKSQAEDYASVYSSEFTDESDSAGWSHFGCLSAFSDCVLVDDNQPITD